MLFYGRLNMKLKVSNQILTSNQSRSGLWADHKAVGRPATPPAPVGMILSGRRNSVFDQIMQKMCAGKGPLQGFG